MSPDAQAWMTYQREQQARKRAEAERLQKALVDAQEMGRADEQQQIEAEMNRLAGEQARRYQNTRQREEAALRAMARWAKPPIARALIEGEPPTALQITESDAQWQLLPRSDEPTKGDPLGQTVPEFDTAVTRSTETQRRRTLIRQALTSVADGARTAEQARLELGKALQVAVDSGLISEQQGLLMMAAGGLNAEPMGQAETRTLLYDVLAQAVLSKQLGFSRARTLARLISEAPKGVNEPPGEVPVPEDPSVMPNLAALRALALRTVPLSDAPLTPAGLERAGPELQRLARAVPELVDRLQALEDLVYEALLVEPCHAGHELHLQTPFLCDDQKSSMIVNLLASLRINARELPRDTHREPNGERAGCCVKDGRIGTWLVYGQLINPDLRMSGERRRQARTRSPDAVAGAAEVNEAMVEEGP